jgi:pyridoxine kinase
MEKGNHTGYRQWQGTKSTAQEITALYEGLQSAYLDDFDMMLSGYIPGAEAVNAMGAIAKALKEKNRDKFFWVLDPVMGDNGRLYVAEDVVPAYRGLVQHADLILPNQFEAELLSGVTINDMASLTAAIQALHDTYKIPHVVITSVTLPHAPEDLPPSSGKHLSVVGSTMTSAGRARLFKIVFPAIDCYFSGTGDMFAALMVIRMREAVSAVSGLDGKRSWQSADDVPTLQLPLVKAAEKTLASMHELLSRTSARMGQVVEKTTQGMTEDEKKDDKKMHLVRTKAAELQLVRNPDCLRDPKVQFRAKEM